MAGKEGAAAGQMAGRPPIILHGNMVTTVLQVWVKEGIVEFDPPITEWKLMRRIDDGTKVTLDSRKADDAACSALRCLALDEGALTERLRMSGSRYAAAKVMQPGGVGMREWAVSTLNTYIGLSRIALANEPLRRCPGDA